ncbi:MAG: diguanylate cyclase [Bacteroidetes bacterium]|nr:diguanylate cyclase [Bacteroidota bacterium]
MSLYSLPPLISALLLLYLVVGIIVLYKKKENINKCLFIFAFLSFWWQFFWFILFNTNSPGLANILVKVGYSGIVFLPLVVNNLLLTFANSKNTKKRLYLHSLIALFFVISIWTTNFFVNGVYSYWFGFYPKASWLHILYLIWLSYLLVGGLFKLYVYYKGLNKNKSEKNKLKFVWVGSFIYVLASIDFLSNYSLSLYPIGFIFILIGLFLYSYSIVKYKLINISYIGKYLLFLSLYIILIILLLTPLFYLKQSFFLIILYVFTCFLTLPFIFNFIKSKSKYFLGEKFEYIHKLNTLENLQKNSLKDLLDWLKNTMKLSSIELFLEEENSFYSYLNNEELTKKNEILKIFSNHNYLFLNEDETLKKTFDYELVLPLYSDDEIIGLLFLGEKENSFFDEIDLKKLKNFTSLIEKYLIFELENNKKYLELMEADVKYLLEATKRIVEIKELKELVENIMNIVLRLTNSQKAGFYLFEDDCFKLEYSKNLHLQEIEKQDGLIQILEQSNKYLTAQRLKDFNVDNALKSFDGALKTMENLDVDIVFPISDNNLIGFIALKRQNFLSTKTLHDINLIAFSSAMAIKNIMLNKKSIKDSFTDCYNRKYLDENIGQLIFKTANEKRSLFLLMIDIDKFKEINDSKGHKEGDRVIKGVVKILNSYKRVSDILFRYGGDEFTMLVRDVDLESIKSMAKRILPSLELKNLGVTLSIGISYLKPREKRYKLDEIEHIKAELLKKADENLFKAKAKGRNGFVV